MDIRVMDDCLDAWEDFLSGFRTRIDKGGNRHVVGGGDAGDARVDLVSKLNRGNFDPGFFEFLKAVFGKFSEAGNVPDTAFLLLHSAQQTGKHTLLSMEAVVGFREDAGVRTVLDFIGDLLSAM